MTEYKYSDITKTIIGSAMKVHSFLGNGFQEVIYQRCLAIEFAKAVFNAVGVRIRNLPITPEKVLKGIY